MGKGDNLGELEHLVLLALLALGDEAYGMSVRRMLAERAGRELSVPTVYSVLDRLQTKGFVSSSVGESTPERGGRAKKLFRVEPAGRRELEDARAVYERMWRAASLGTETP